MLGPTVRYDHRLTLWVSGSDDDAGIEPIHKTCDDIKTPADLKMIAKVKRLIAAREGKTKPKRPIPGRGFDKTRSRGFDGKVRPR